MESSVVNFSFAAESWSALMAERREEPIDDGAEDMEYFSATQHRTRSQAELDRYLKPRVQSKAMESYKTMWSDDEEDVTESVNLDSDGTLIDVNSEILDADLTEEQWNWFDNAAAQSFPRDYHSGPTPEPASDSEDETQRNSTDEGESEQVELFTGNELDTRKESTKEEEDSIGKETSERRNEESEPAENTVATSLEPACNWEQKTTRGSWEIKGEENRKSDGQINN